MDRFWSLLERRRLLGALVAAFAVLLLTTLVLAINAILAARDMSRQAAELYRMELLGISHIKQANIDLISTGRTLRQMVLAPTFVDRDEARAQLNQTMLDLEEQIAAARQSIFRDQERLLLNEFELEFEHYKHNVNDAITLIDRSTDYQQKATLYISGEQFNRVGDSADQLLHRMVAIKEEGARETTVAMAGHSRDMQRLMLELLLGGLLFGAAVGVLIGRAIKQPADRLCHSTHNGAKGNVGDAIPLTGYRDELGAEEQSMAMETRQAELIQTEARGIVENRPDDMLMTDEQSALIAPEHVSPQYSSPEYTAPKYSSREYRSRECTAKIRGEESTREHFESLDGPPIAPVRRASILVVEDNESNQEVTVGLPAIAGCKITVASNGQEALELLAKNRYDVVLMNMQMPMMEGINATLEIRKNPAFDRLPIIAMTTNAIHQEWARCLAAGMDGHIAKPIDPDELFRAFMCWMTPEMLCGQPRDHRNAELPRI
jgi:CheY-like chemotaxis protein